MTTKLSFKKFADTFNKSDKARQASIQDILKLEGEFSIILPDDYKDFLTQVGDIWTPNILNIIVDKDLDMNDVTEFWDIDRIIYDKKNEWTSELTVDLIPIASDSMGNIFAFKATDLKTTNQTADIYFFDHDFDTVDKVADSFTKWLDDYNEI